MLKELKGRIADGSLSKYSMHNCCFDPTKRNLEYDPVAPSGYYRLDLEHHKDREILKKLLSECKHRKADIFRNEKIQEKRVSLPKKLVMGGYDGNWKGWEVCVCVCVCVHVRMHVRMHDTYVCVYAGVCVCMYVCMYVCLYLCMYAYLL
jgi:hypothetical protein